MSRAKTPRQGARLAAFVATIGDSFVAVRAWDADDARARIIDQLRLGHLVGVADDIHIRPATHLDADLLDRFEGGSRLFRLEWARDARAATSDA